MEEFYFCLHLTENEHYIVNDDIQEKCNELGCNLLYYRKLKEYHVPMYREVKITGTRPQLSHFRQWMDLVYLRPEKNPISR